MPWPVIGLVVGVVVVKILVECFAKPEPRGSNRATVKNTPGGGRSPSGGGSMSPWGTSGSSGSLPSQRWGPGRSRRYG